MGFEFHSIPMEKEKIAEHLRNFLEVHELTQEEFARMISAPLSSLSSWLHGKRQMSKIWQKVLQEKAILPTQDKQEGGSK